MLFWEQVAVGNRAGEGCAKKLLTAAYGACAVYDVSEVVLRARGVTGAAEGKLEKFRSPTVLEVPASLICHEGTMNNRTSLSPTATVPHQCHRSSINALIKRWIVIRSPLHDWSELHYLLDALRCAAHPPPFNITVHQEHLNLERKAS
jgi:hypothetical protein